MLAVLKFISDPVVTWSVGSLDIGCIGQRFVHVCFPSGCIVLDHIGSTDHHLSSLFIFTAPLIS